MHDPDTADVPLGTWVRSLTEAPGSDSPKRDPDHSKRPTPSAVQYMDVPVDRIVANPRQPRSVFDEDALDELAESMRLVGLLQPVVVRPRPTVPVDNRGDTHSGPLDGQFFELIAGERRLRCARRLGWYSIAAVVRPTDDADLLRDALLENVHRANLNPLEEAAAYQQLLTDFDCTQEQLARHVGRSRPQIANTMRLLRLPPAVQRRVAAGVLSQGHARALLALPDEQAMSALADRIVAEGLSVRMVEEIVALGEYSASRARGRTQSPRQQDLHELSERLGDRWDTRVQVTMGRHKGKVTIEFAGREDLDRLLELLVGDGTAT